MRLLKYMCYILSRNFCDEFRCFQCLYRFSRYERTSFIKAARFGGCRSLFSNNSFPSLEINYVASEIKLDNEIIQREIICLFQIPFHHCWKCEQIKLYIVQTSIFQMFSSNNIQTPITHTIHNNTVQSCKTRADITIERNLICRSKTLSEYQKFH